MIRKPLGRRGLPEAAFAERDEALDADLARRGGREEQDRDGHADCHCDGHRQDKCGDEGDDDQPARGAADLPDRGRLASVDGAEAGHDHQCRQDRHRHLADEARNDQHDDEHPDATEDARPSAPGAHADVECSLADRAAGRNAG